LALFACTLIIARMSMILLKDVLLVRKEILVICEYISDSGVLVFIFLGWCVLRETWYWIRDNSSTICKSFLVNILCKLLETTSRPLN
jgi:hypothetical protein